MSVDRKEIDLIIRAALQGGKTLESVTKSIKEIEKALDDQTAAAKRGESSFDELKVSLESLKRLQRDLGDQASLVGQFRDLGTQIGNTTAKIADASQKYTELDAKIAAAGKSTKRETQQLASYQRLVDSGNKSIALWSAQYDSLGNTLRQAGVDTNDLAGATSRLRQTAADLAAITRRGEESMRSYAADVRKAREAEKALADQRKGEEQRLASIRAFRQAITDQRLAEIGAAEKEAAAQAKVSEALRKSADEAIAAARGYKTLGTAAKGLAASRTGLRDTIAGILDPAAQARTSLAGVEAELQKLGDRIGKISGPVANYRDKLAQLTAAQKALAQQASQVDSYNQQLAALRQARAEFTQARAQVLQFAAALRESKGQNDQLQASLRAAQTTLNTAQASLARQVVTTRELRDSMRQAGLSTQDLASTQARLTSAAQTSTAAMQQLVAAKKRFGERTDDATRKIDIFNTSGRTTLGMLQRWRGEVLSLVAAYAGLYGAINGAKAVVDTFNQRQATINQLSISFGDPAAEYEYLREQADRLGVSIAHLGENYAKFAAGATRAGAKTQQVKFIFESFSEAARVMNLSGERQGLVFKALTDIMSKGAIQAEELKNQLGDSLPGIFGIAQDALASKYPNLQKALKDGKVQAEELLTISKELKASVADQLPAATASLAANQERFNNAMVDFKLAIADSGFIEQVTKLVKSTTEFLKSEDGKKFADDLGGAMSTVADALRFVVENFETLKVVLRDVIVLWGAWKLVQVGAQLHSLSKRVGELREAFDGLNGTSKIVLRGFALLSAFAAGWEFGTILSQKFAVVRQAGVALVIGFQKIWTNIKYGAQIIWEEIPAVFSDGFSALGNIATFNLRKLTALFAKAARAIGATEIATSADSAIASLTFKTDRLGDASKKLRAELAAELAKIDSIGFDMFVEAGGGRTSSPTAKRTPAATGIPSDLSFGDNSASDAAATEAAEKAAKNRREIQEQLEKDLRAIDVRIAKNEDETLSDRLVAVEARYAELRRRIVEFGGEASKGMLAELDRKVAILRGQEADKFNEELLKKEAVLRNKLEDMGAKFDRRQKSNLDARLGAVDKQYADVYRDIDKLLEGLVANGQDPSVAFDFYEQADAAKAVAKSIETQKVYEEQINALYDARQGKIDAIIAKVASGALTPQEGNAQIELVNDETIAQIDAVIQKMRELKATVSDPEMQTALQLAIDAMGGKLEKLRLDTLPGMAGAMAGLREELRKTDEGFAKAAVGAGVDAITGLFTDLVSGTKSAGDALRDFVLGFVRSMEQIAARALATYLVLSMLDAIYPGLGKTVAATMSVGSQFHSGGVVGSGGTPRRIDASWFANAPRYHSGGIAGLAPDEYPAILKKNEEVLTQSDPRNVLNGGKSAAAGGSAQNLKIVNMIDSGSVISEGLSTQPGTKAILNFISANRTEVKSILGG